MTNTTSQNQRVVSGMRPTGKLHLGHYHGVLKNWVKMQHSYECFFFIADWHALTTHYTSPQEIPQHVEDMLIDWLAAGISPTAATLFVQSHVPEHAELHLLLSMITPLSWLERVPTYKDIQQKLNNKDLSTYGFLGYPLLQSADILIYKADFVPVGEDQVAHVELTREVARRFNHLYGREEGFEEKSKKAIIKMGKKSARLYRNLRKIFQGKGDIEALERGKALLAAQQNISLGDKERLFGYLEGSAKLILPEPQAKLTKAAKMPGLDGQKMSKSYHNTIALRDNPIEIEKKLRKMPTDPARVRRNDPGDPNKCPVWQLHKIYTNEERHQWVKEGCHSASIGCIDCKQPIIDAVLSELKPVQERAKQYQDDKSLLQKILREGSEAARDTAQETMEDVLEAMRFVSDR